MTKGLNKKTLTNANSILRFRCQGIYNNWIEFQGFQVDNRTTLDDRTTAQVLAGVDGYISGGYTHEVQVFNVHLLPNSPQIEMMRVIQKDQDENMEVRTFEFEQVNTSLGRQSSFEGYLVSSPSGSGGGKLFQGEKYTFHVSASVEDSI